jgi:hypothetical protein
LPRNNRRPQTGSSGWTPIRGTRGRARFASQTTPLAEIKVVAFLARKPEGAERA